MSNDGAASRQRELYDEAVRESGAALDRLALGYEADPDKRRDLRQEIHLQLWRSLAGFDGRCSLKTWSFRVAHNAAASYVGRERRANAQLVSLEELDRMPPHAAANAELLDHERALERLQQLILKLKPLDRQIILSYLEGMDAATTAEITGLSAANVAMKVHRIKSVLARHYSKEQSHV